MPLFDICLQCHARFVVDETEQQGSRVAGAASRCCEACRRESLEWSLIRTQEWVKATGLIAMVFFVWAGVSLQKQKRHDDLEWAGQLGVAVIATLLAAFFYFRRLRPQHKLVEAGRQLDLTTGESADVRRRHGLEKLGVIDCDGEARVLRKRLESSLKRSVALGLADKEELREHRRCSRLLDEIAGVDWLLDHVESEAVDSGTVLPADLDRLRTQRDRLCEQLERRPIWPRVMRGLVSQGLLHMRLLPVTLLMWMLFRSAWQKGNILLITATLTCILMPILQVVCRMWLERPARQLIGSAPDPTGETSC